MDKIIKIYNAISNIHQKVIYNKFGVAWIYKNKSYTLTIGSMICKNKK